MDLIQAVLMGITQGLSEFLPISSSGHLVFTSGIYKVFKGIEVINTSNQEVFLDIMLHLGTLIAVLIFFRKEITDIIKQVICGIKSRNYSSEGCQTGIHVIIGTITTVIIAYPLNPVSEHLVFMPAVVGILLIGTGLLLLFGEWFAKRYKEKLNMDTKCAILTGIAQGLAILPGFSRSGLTMAIGLIMGQDREKIARYSFLLSIPVILGASMVYPLFKIDFSEITGFNWAAITIGTIFSGIIGYFCIKYFLKFISKFSLAVFGYYCLIMGIISAIFFSITL